MRRRASEGGQSVRRLDGQILSFVLWLLAAYPPIRLPAQQVNNSGALFLVFPVGARAVGMGQTAAALDGRGEAAFWNPAGLATLEKNEFGLQSATLVAGNTDAVTAYFPSHRVGVLGGAIYLVDYGDLDRTDATGNTIGRISPRNLEFVASYAAGIAGAVTFGVNYKLVQFVVDCSGDCTNLPSARGTTHAVDVGLKVAADVDSPWGSYGGSQMRVGLDVGYQRLFRVRGGYAFVRDGLSGPSVGVGVETGAIGVDLARSFLAGSDLVVANPTFFSFRVVF